MGFPKGGFASQFREIATSGIEINSEKWAQEEDQVGEMVPESHLERETIPNEGRRPEKSYPIIRPKRRAASCYLEKK